MKKLSYKIFCPKKYYEIFSATSFVRGVSEFVKNGEILTLVRRRPEINQNGEISLSNEPKNLENTPSPVLPQLWHWGVWELHISWCCCCCCYCYLSRVLMLAKIYTYTNWQKKFKWWFRIKHINLWFIIQN